MLTRKLDHFLINFFGKKKKCHELRATRKKSRRPLHNDKGARRLDACVSAVSRRFPPIYRNSLYLRAHSNVFVFTHSFWEKATSAKLEKDCALHGQ